MGGSGEPVMFSTPTLPIVIGTAGGYLNKKVDKFPAYQPFIFFVTIISTLFNIVASHTCTLIFLFVFFSDTALY